MIYWMLFFAFVLGIVTDVVISSLNTRRDKKQKLHIQTTEAIRLSKTCYDNMVWKTTLEACRKHDKIELRHEICEMYTHLEKQLQELKNGQINKQSKESCQKDSQRNKTARKGR